MRGVSIGLAVLLASPGHSFSPNPQAGPTKSEILDQIRNHHRGIAVWWMGNSGWLIKSNDLLFGTDLDLESGNKVSPPPLGAELLAGELDVAFVTHHHGDHFNSPTLRALAREPRCSFVLPQTCIDGAARLGIPRDRIIVPHPLTPFEIKGIRVEPIHAIHGNQEFTVLTREKDFIDGITYSCGYVFTVQGKRILEPGDSVLTEEHLNLKQIDVLFVSATVHTRYIDRSMILITRLQPAYIFPQHFGTYVENADNRFWTHGYPDELYLRLSSDLQKRYHKLRIGEMVIIQ